MKFLSHIRNRVRRCYELSKAMLEEPNADKFTLVHGKLGRAIDHAWMHPTFDYRKFICDFAVFFVKGAAQAGDYEVSTSIRGEGVKIKEIAEAMDGNTVWCCNSWFAPLRTPCAEVAGCTFKDRQVRQATPRELYRCRMFQITTISSSWETAAHVYPTVDR